MTIFKKIVTDIYIVSWALFKVLIPTLIVVKIAEMAGAVYWLNVAMAPIVTMIGLPADMAIVLTTTMLTNPYAGFDVAKRDAICRIPKCCTDDHHRILHAVCAFPAC